MLLTILVAGTFKNLANFSIVSQPGVATLVSSLASSGSCLKVSILLAISRLAAYVPFSLVAMVSSPIAAGAWNSVEFLPPIVPESAITGCTVTPARLKIRLYALF